jgi:hypothetical protein
MNEIIEEVIKAYGDVKAVQQRFSYSEPMGVYNWRKRGIPRSLVAEIYVDTDIPINRLMKATRIPKAV